MSLIYDMNNFIADTDRSGIPHEIYRSQNIDGSSKNNVKRHETR